MMARAFIFDVDGTLTPSRGKIQEDFRLQFVNFCDTHDVYLVTGSDYEKTVEQLGTYICDHAVTRIYNCSGNSVWEKGISLFDNELSMNIEIHSYLSNTLELHPYRERTGLHLEKRPGLYNFSIPGQSTTREERANYIEYDLKNNDRTNIANAFNRLFTDRFSINAHVAGETGIDITKVGNDKRQVLDDFPDHDVTFFGDKMEVGGNDWPLRHVIDVRNFFNDNDDNKWHAVSSWKDTAKILKDNY